MASKKNDDRKTVVIVGGGSAGITAAYALSSKLSPEKHNLILIDARPYRIALPACIRLVVSSVDKLEDSAFIPYDKVFAKGIGSFVQGDVVDVRQNADAKHGAVVLKSGEEIAYDVLVLSPGSVWEGRLTFPNTADEITAFVEDGRRKYEDAKDVLLVRDRTLLPP